MKYDSNYWKGYKKGIQEGHRLTIIGVSLGLYYNLKSYELHKKKVKK